MVAENKIIAVDPVTQQELNNLRKYKIEKWTSSEGRTEIHYFDATNDEYLFGYNPLIMPEDLLDDLRRWASKYKS